MMVGRYQRPAREPLLEILFLKAYFRVCRRHSWGFIFSRRFGGVSKTKSAEVCEGWVWTIPMGDGYNDKCGEGGGQEIPRSRL